MCIQNHRADFKKVEKVAYEMDNLFEEKQKSKASRGEIAREVFDILNSKNLNSIERAIVCSYIYEAYGFSFR